MSLLFHSLAEIPSFQHFSGCSVVHKSSSLTFRCSLVGLASEYLVNEI